MITSKEVCKRSSTDSEEPLHTSHQSALTEAFNFLCLSPKKGELACRLHIQKLIEMFTIDKRHSGITL